MSTLEKIKSRGYWEIVIRPTRFVEQRVQNVPDLRDIARNQRVEFRGWDFPHYGYPEPRVAKDHIHQDVDFLRHVEAWRLYQSGQFVYMGALRADWDEQDPQRGVRWVLQPGTILGVADTIWTLTEAFEFAARLGMSAAGSDRMHVAATVHGLEGRQLHMEIDNRYLSPRPALEGVPRWSRAADFAREQLISDSKKLVVAWAHEVLALFGWNAPLSILSDIQAHFD